MPVTDLEEFASALAAARASCSRGVVVGSMVVKTDMRSEIWKKSSGV
jgi:hypothetical protein